MTAFSASCVNLCRGTIPELLGLFFNTNFLHITNENLDNYYLVPIIAIIGACYEVLISRLIPLRKDIEEVINFKVQKKVTEIMEK